MLTIGPLDRAVFVKTLRALGCVLLLASCDSRSGEPPKSKAAPEAPSEADEQENRAWIEAQTPEVRARLERLAAIEKDASAHAPLEGVEIASAPKTTLTFESYSAQFNTGFVTPLELRLPCPRARRDEKKEDPDRALPTRRFNAKQWLEPAACLAANKNPHLQTGDTQELRQSYEKFLSTEFVAVLHAQAEVQGRILDTELGSSTFESGALRAQVLVYRTADGTYVAGFPILAQNSDSFGISGSKGKYKGLEENLADNFSKALEEALATHLPTDVPKPVK